MEENWKIAHELRAHIREAQTALRQNEIEHRQLETVRRLEAAVAEAKREAPSSRSEQTNYRLSLGHSQIASLHRPSVDLVPQANGEYSRAGS